MRNIDFRPVPTRFIINFNVTCALAASAAAVFTGDVNWMFLAIWSGIIAIYFFVGQVYDVAAQILDYVELLRYKDRAKEIIADITAQQDARLHTKLKDPDTDL